MLAGGTSDWEEVGEEGGLGERGEGRGKGKEETVGKEGVVDVWTVPVSVVRTQTKAIMVRTEF